jgi:sugar phosphate isomerase/epimerase
MTRRELLLAAAPLAGAPPRSPLGVASTCWMSYRRFRDTLELIGHAAAVGGAGVQAALSSLEPDYLRRVREACERHNLYFEAMVALPKTDTAQFERSLRAAKECGALCARAACLGGRRYETFSTLEEWKSFVAQSRRAIAAAVPAADRIGLPLALENHKDWTLEELHTLMREYSGENFGVCLDTGNNISLLDDAHEFVEALAPWALSTHIKDMALQHDPDGFLLAEVPLGEGVLDLARIMTAIRKARPRTKLTLEMITRNPLRVPCLTEKYWVTFGGREGSRLAATLRPARNATRPLPTDAALSPRARIDWEEDNVRACLAWARRHVQT